MKTRILGKDIIFQFKDDVSGGLVKKTSTASGIILAGQQIDQQRQARWGKVVAVGTDITEEIKVGSYILIEPLMWTVGFTFDSDVKFWKTHETKVLAVSDEEISD